MKETQFAQIYNATTKLVIALAGPFFLAGCQTAGQWTFPPAVECGSWTFLGTPYSPASNAPVSSFNVNVAFDFYPQIYCVETAHNCLCGTTCMIQLASPYDVTQQQYVYPNSGDELRATPSGWTIDQDLGWAYAYYGLNNDGTFNDGYNIPGSNFVPTILKDNPQFSPNYYVRFMDVAVCFSSEECQNSILGYYFWSCIEAGNGEFSKIISVPAGAAMESEFTNAVDAWNDKWVTNSGPQNEGPGQPAAPHAYPLPPMKDL